MFRVKVCGIRDASTAAFCCSVGVDAIGLNFYAKSKRYVSLKQAGTIVGAMEQSTLKVGLFVNHDASRIVEYTRELGLDAVQLHGNETIDLAEQLSEMPESTKIIRAIRISPENERNALNEVEAWSTLPSTQRVGAILLDPLVKNAFGGTGQQIDWNWLAGLDLPTELPLILAGGLTSENVAQAISIVKPHGVDVAGGVEDSDGIKNPELIRTFCDEAFRLIDRT